METFVQLVESHGLTFPSIMGMVVGDTDAMVTGVAISTTNMLISSLSLRAGSVA